VWIVAGLIVLNLLSMSALPPDPQLEIHGYVTDPHQVGYQQLTNYESTYWRPLVGRDAWACFEVLRSFCHAQRHTCEITLRTLIDILGLTDRRQLTGRITKTRGQERYYPGLIDILQEYQLVFAEEIDSGPNLRYRFHVTMKPPQLKSDQVAQLSSRLQARHARLIERVLQSQSQLAALRERPLKQPKQQSRGMAPIQEGVAPVHPPNGTHPPKQHRSNRTQITTTKHMQIPDIDEKRIHSPDQAGSVVVDLMNLGIRESHAKKLAKTAQINQVDILELIAYGRYQLEQAPNKIRNLKRWVISGINRGYDLTEWQQIKTEQAANKAERAEQLQKQKQMYRDLAERQRQQTKQQAEQDRIHIEQLHKEYGTSQQTIERWRQALQQLTSMLSPAQLGLLHNAHLLEVNEQQAVIAVASTFIAQKLTSDTEIRNTLCAALFPDGQTSSEILTFLDWQTQSPA